MENVTYLGRRARIVALNKNMRPTNGIAERVVILQHVDEADPKNGGHPAGSVIAKHVRGDGRDRSFHVFAEEVFVGEDALERAYEWAEQRFAAIKHKA